MEKLNNYESEYIKEELKWAINGIDIVGCGLSQNISKKLKENTRFPNYYYESMVDFLMRTFINW